MTKLPTNLTYFASLNGFTQVLRNLALPLFKIEDLNDPFLPVTEQSLPFTVSEFYEETVKYIIHAILGRSPPRGQPDHSLQRAIIRWRAEERFNDELEIKETLSGLLPGMVEPVFNEAKADAESVKGYISSKRIVPFFEKHQDLGLWELEGFAHKGVAVKFKCAEDTIFNQCQPVNYTKAPVSLLDSKKYMNYMVGLTNQIDSDPSAVLLAQNHQKRKFREWRLIIDNDAVSDSWLPFSADLIHSVYLGALVKDSAIRQIKKALLKINPKINLYKASCKAGEYAFEFDKLTDELAEDNSANAASSDLN